MSVCHLTGMAIFAKNKDYRYIHIAYNQWMNSSTIAHLLEPTFAKTPGWQVKIYKPLYMCRRVLVSVEITGQLNECAVNGICDLTERLVIYQYITLRLYIALIGPFMYRIYTRKKHNPVIHAVSTCLLLYVKPQVSYNSNKTFRERQRPRAAEIRKCEILTECGHSIQWLPSW